MHRHPSNIERYSSDHMFVHVTDKGFAVNHHYHYRPPARGQLNIIERFDYFECVSSIYIFSFTLLNEVCV